ncbi:DEAD/DEAH box helicase [Clostridiaceae bacterium M8S5]|nr:DEAD/DEAH box helicase [Clostridiaceae bacterium M8S5]
MSFYKLGIKGDLVYALDCLNISSPTPIQTLSIPHILKGGDLIAEAQTGTGKTYAFLLPIFQNIDENNDFIQALIVTPTRELAIQITDVAKQLTDVKPINVLACYGGQDILAQLHKLKNNVNLVVGTPGRILDYLRRGAIDFKHVKTLVVDEADQMFHIGFIKDIDNIINNLPINKQTLCFSATISQSVDLFANKYLKKPKFVKAPKKQVTLESISQFIVETSNRQKFDDFIKIVKRDFPNKAIIFCRSRVGTQKLCDDMKALGLNVGTIHGGLTQAKREEVMKEFKNNDIKYITATDVASRGLDIEGVSHVFNYNLPDEPENYVHRIGRTGRAGNIGVAYTILTQKDERRMEAIESFIKMKIDRIRVSKPNKEISTNAHNKNGKKTAKLRNQLK